MANMYIIGKQVAAMYNNYYDKMADNIAKISSGNRITCAADDAAGLSIAEKMESQMNGTEMAMKNTQDAISMIQTADGTLDSVTKVLQRMNELAVQAANGTNADNDLNALNDEYIALIDQINQFASDSEFNTIKLFKNDNGDTSNSFHIQTGPNAGNSLMFSIDVMNSDVLGLTGTDLLSNNNASSAIDTVKKALEKITRSRSHLGATQNRLEFSYDAQENYLTNITDSYSRIMDVDIASEALAMARNATMANVNSSLMVQVNKALQSQVSFIQKMLE